MHAVWAADLTIAVVEPLAGFVGACVALGLLVVLAVTPILLEMAVLVAPPSGRSYWPWTTQP